MVERFRLAGLLKQRNSNSKIFVGKLSRETDGQGDVRSIADVDGDFDSEDDEDADDGEMSEGDDSEDFDGQPTDSKVNTVKVVLKADTDLVLSTILDAVDEAEENKDIGVAEVTDVKNPLKFKLIASSVGEINTNDILIANSASGQFHPPSLLMLE
jgi:hypothetical protein